MDKMHMDVFKSAAQLKEHIVRMESIMSAQHYDAMPDNEKAEFRSLLLKRKEKLAEIILTITSPELDLELEEA